MFRKPLLERVQDLVYSLEEGIGATIIKVCVAILLLSGVVVVYVATQFYGLQDPAAMESAQLARNLARSGRFETSVIRPMDFWHLKKTLGVRLPFGELDKNGNGRVDAGDGAPAALFQRFQDKDGDGALVPDELGLEQGRIRPADQDFRHIIYDGKSYRLQLPGSMDTRVVEESNMLRRFPDLRHAPGYPAVLAGMFRLFEPSFAVTGRDHKNRAELVVLGLGIVLTVFSGVFVFFLACMLFDLRTGVVAVLFFTAGNLVWQQAISGLETSLLLLLSVVGLTGAVWWVKLAEMETGLGRRVIAALMVLVCIAGLLLTRYGACIVLAGFFLFLVTSLPRRSWLIALLLMALGAAALLPWLSRNQRVSGSWFGTAPYTVLADTPTFPEKRFERSFAPNFIPKVAEIEVRRKAITTLEARLPELVALLGGGLICSVLFIASFFFRFESAVANALRWCFFVPMLLWLPMVGVFGDAGMRLGVVFIPLGVVYAAGLFHLALARFEFELRMTNQLVTAAATVVVGLPLMITLLPPQPRLTTFTNHPGTIAVHASMFEPWEWISSDIPVGVAWHGDRQALALPAHRDDFERINDHIQFLHGLYFTRETTDRPFFADFGTATSPEQSWAELVFGQKIERDFPLKYEDSLLPGQILFFDRIDRAPKTQ